MIRVVLDTNVLVSGTFWSGPSARIIKLIEQKRLELISSRAILEEYNFVMDYDEIKRKVNHHHERAQAALKLAQLGTLVHPRTRIHVIKEDPSDDKFIEAAMMGKARFIISQDKHLLNLKRYQNVIILTPEEFLKTI